MVDRSNSQFLAASVNKFMRIWAFGGEASLNITTRKGVTTVNLNCTLGNPGAPFSSPTPSPRQPRHRGPSEKRRNSKRAACHQAGRLPRQQLLLQHLAPPCRPHLDRQQSWPSFCSSGYNNGNFVIATQKGFYLAKLPKKILENK